MPAKRKMSQATSAAVQDTVPSNKKPRTTVGKGVLTAAASRSKRGSDHPTEEIKTRKQMNKFKKSEVVTKNPKSSSAATSNNRGRPRKTSNGTLLSPEAKRPVATSPSTKPRRLPRKTSKSTPANLGAKSTLRSRRSSSVSVEVPTYQTTNEIDGTNVKATNETETINEGSGVPSYWLMKAEPESRIEKGKDVKFSIDDLKAATEPEGWDGVRNFAARNNMREMKKGDLAFFYHSNCKVPGIAGVMEIVREHSVDGEAIYLGIMEWFAKRNAVESAFDPDHPYYDATSKVDEPKWSLVHVEFRRKFPKLVKLKELQQFARSGGILENLQTLKLNRLSVSKVTKDEWDFILGLVEPDEESEGTAVDKAE